MRAWIFAVVLLMVLAESPSPFPVTEITQREPYADYVGRECRVVAHALATAWNDFPDKTKILEITLMAPPGIKNRFVSYATHLKPDQRTAMVFPTRRSANQWTGRNRAPARDQSATHEGRHQHDGVNDPVDYGRGTSPTGTDTHGNIEFFRRFRAAWQHGLPGVFLRWRPQCLAVGTTSSPG